jgi:serine/threonine protein phosphatase PrpC
VAAGATLAAAVRRSHDAVLARTREGVTTAGMGSTVVALLMQGREYEVAWVGDSRAYLFRCELTQITHDHSRVNELIAKNLISKEQAHAHPHVLTQSLGISQEMELNLGSAAGCLQPGEQILLCSDGLNDELSDGDIAPLMAANKSPRAQVDALIMGALRSGGADNVTVVAVGDNPVEAQGVPTRTENHPKTLETTQNRFQTGHHKPSHRAEFPFKVLIALIALIAVASLSLLLLQ